MKPLTILRVEAEDRRFDLEEGAGTERSTKSPSTPSPSLTW